MSQKTIAQLNAEIDAQITSNGANAITAAVMRPVLKDMADSAANVADGQTLYTGNGTCSGDRTVNVSTHILEINADNGADLHAQYYFTNNFIAIQVQNNGPGDLTKVQIEDGSLLLFCSPVGAGDGVKIGDTDQKVGFLGATPVVRVASADQAVATDPASTQTLANALRSALIDLGLIKGSA